MNPTSVVSTVTLPAKIQQAIERDFSLRVISLRDAGTSSFLAELGTPSAIICAPGDRVDASLIARLPATVRLLASYSVGLDHIDTAAASARGIEVSNTPDVLTDATADTAMLLLLGALRGARRAQQVLYSGQWQAWKPTDVYGVDLSGRCFGIVGAGRIGGATARRARAFGMSLHYWSRSSSRELDELGARRYLEFDEFLSNVDVVSLHVPSTAETHNLIGQHAINCMRPGAVLINTARGDIVDDDVVIAALTVGKIAAAGIDVFRNEPAIDPRWLELDNVYLLPHVGSATVETRLAMGQAVVAALQRCLLNEA